MWKICLDNSVTVPSHSLSSIATRTGGIQNVDVKRVDICTLTLNLC